MKAVFKKEEISLSVEMMAITCLNCKVSFAVYGIIKSDDELFKLAFPQGHDKVKKMFCPYCGNSLVDDKIPDSKE